MLSEGSDTDDSTTSKRVLPPWFSCPSFLRLTSSSVIHLKQMHPSNESTLSRGSVEAINWNDAYSSVLHSVWQLSISIHRSSSIYGIFVTSTSPVTKPKLFFKIRSEPYSTLPNSRPTCDSNYSFICWGFFFHKVINYISEAPQKLFQFHKNEVNTSI